MVNLNSHLGLGAGQTRDFNLSLNSYSYFTFATLHFSNLFFLKKYISESSRLNVRFLF